jgi:putative tryptophan/tyrosine transport system substrate-binding protein
MPVTIARRDLIAAIGSAAIAWSSMARAEQPGVQQPAAKKRMTVIGFGPVSTLRIGGHPLATLFFEELKRLGYVEGENLLVERYQFQPDGIANIAREVVRTHPDVIVSYGMPMTTSLKALTSTIPIVAMTGDPIRFGLIKSLAHPGGNITGVSVDAGVDVWGKRLELLSLAVAKLANILFVSTQGGWDGAGGQAVRSAAQKLGISVMQATLNAPYDEAECRRLLSSIQRDELDGVVVADETQLFSVYSLLIRSFQQMRLPAIYPLSEHAEAGGLMAYGQDIKSGVRTQVAQIVEVLRGANPGDIPYFQATKFDLVINMKTAKDLGLELPDGLVAGASAVIE